MKTTIIAALILSLPLLGFAQQRSGGGSRLFTYQYTIDDLPNGLRLVTIPTDYPNLVALYVVVSAGSRNEIEAGRSGYAHFFEHIMFRGSQNFPPERREEIFKRAGAETNAYTSDDRTVYHATFSKEDLDQIMQVEADRFLRLKYSPEQCKTESKAIKGEYDKNSSNPFTKMHEVLRETAFKRHTYSHTTMGYLKDIEDMPNNYDYSKQFYQRFYRPEYATILLVGDVTHERALELTKKYWGEWQHGNYKADIPDEPEQKESRTAHIDWDATRSRTRYGFAMALDSNDRIAGALASYVSLARTPETLNRLFETYQKVTPEDIRDAARKYFREESRTVVTLSTKGQKIASADNGKEGGR